MSRGGSFFLKILYRPSLFLTSGDGYLYYVQGETLFRRTAKEGAPRRMLVLPEAADDGAELLRQALAAEVFNVRYSVAPHQAKTPVSQTNRALPGKIGAWQQTLRPCGDLLPRKCWHGCIKKNARRAGAA